MIVDEDISYSDYDSESEMDSLVGGNEANDDSELSLDERYL